MSTIKNHGQVLLQSGTGNDLFLDMNGSDRSGQTMAGGAGNDVYQVDSGEDFVIENAGGGIDTVEIVTTTYWDEYAYWDSQDYWDPYYYFNGEYWEGAYVGGYDGAWVTEGLQDGYTLGANVENLTVDGENTGYWWWDSFAFAGNAEANVIDISNTWGDGGELYGLAGNDTLIGSNGSDWLDGGAGATAWSAAGATTLLRRQCRATLVIEVTDNTATV
jgi:Ca2+-binding RTX toxin-like protein